MNSPTPDQQLIKTLTGIADNVAAIQSRLSSLESDMVTKLDIIGLKGSLNKMETKIATIDGKITHASDKLDKKFLDLFDFLDGDVMRNKRRLDELEQRLGLSL